MKKITLTNRALSNIIAVFSDPNGFRFNKEIKTRMAVRQSLKSIIQTIGNAWNIALETWNEIIMEVQNDFIEAGKAERTEENFVVKPEFIDEFNRILTEKDKEFSDITVEIETQTIPEKTYLLYAEDNDGKFSDMELDVLELFVESE